MIKSLKTVVPHQTHELVESIVRVLRPRIQSSRGPESFSYLVDLRNSKYGIELLRQITEDFEDLVLAELPYHWEWRGFSLQYLNRDLNPSLESCRILVEFNSRERSQALFEAQKSAQFLVEKNFPILNGPLVVGEVRISGFMCHDLILG